MLKTIHSRHGEYLRHYFEIRPPTGVSWSARTEPQTRSLRFDAEVNSTESHNVECNNNNNDDDDDGGGGGGGDDDDDNNNNNNNNWSSNGNPNLDKVVEGLGQ